MSTSRSILALLSLAWSTQVADAAERPQSLAFRLASWKDLSFENTEEARQQLQTLKQLGCEARIDQQSPGAHLRFRAVRWTKVTLDTQELADEWEKWLKTTGFETLHAHDKSPAKDAVAVHFRMPKSATRHVTEADQAKELLAIYSGLGCEVQQAQHSGHIDLTVSCPNWRNLIFETHEQAHSMQKWLQEHGFQTHHEH